MVIQIASLGMASKFAPEFGVPEPGVHYPRMDYSQAFRNRLLEYHRGPDGKIYDTSGIEIRPGDYWEVGHAGLSYAERVLQAQQTNMSPAQWRAQERDLRLLRPELIYTNSSNKFQDWPTASQESGPGKP
jgi:hypothetical protein